MANEITESGGKLFDLIGKEAELRNAREKAMVFLDNIGQQKQGYVEKCIREIIEQQTQSI